MNKDDLIYEISKKIKYSEDQAKYYLDQQVKDPNNELVPSWVELRNFYEGRLSAYLNAKMMAEDLS